MRKATVRVPVGAAAVILGLCGVVGGVNAQVRVIARTGDLAPGSSSNFTSFLSNDGLAPGVSSAGDVVFPARTSSSAYAFSQGLWRSRGSAPMDLLHWYGRIDPADPLARRQSELSSVQIDRGGRVSTFGVLRTGAGTPSGSLWSDGPSGYRLTLNSETSTLLNGYAVRAGAVIQADSATELTTPFIASESAAIWPSVTSGTGGNILWSINSGSAVATCFVGQTAPGCAPATFATLSRRMSDNGSSILSGTLTGQGVTSSNRTGIWVHSAGGLELAARTGSPAPGTLQQTSFLSLTLPAGANGIGPGSAAFFGSAMGSSATSYVTGLWCRRNNTTLPVAIQGQPAPGMGSGAVFTPLGESAQLQTTLVTRLGAVFFTSVTSGGGTTPSNNRGVWLWRDGVASLIFRGGQQVPGLQAGITFANASPSVPSLGPVDAVVFTARVQGPGISSANDSCLVLAETGKLRVLAREGQRLGSLVLGDLFGVARTQASESGCILAQVTVVGPNGSSAAGLLRVQPDGTHDVPVAIGESILIDGATRRVADFRISSESAMDSEGTVCVALQCDGSPAGYIALIPINGGVLPGDNCTADIDGDQSLTESDLFMFLDNWFSGQGDYNSSGTVDSNDVYDFLNDWFRGC